MLRARSPSSPVPPAARAAATPCGWPRRAPTSSRSTSARTSRPTSTRSPRRTTSKETARLVEAHDRRIVTVEADVRERSQLAAALEQGIAELGQGRRRRRQRRHHAAGRRAQAAGLDRRGRHQLPRGRQRRPRGAAAPARRCLDHRDRLGRGVHDRRRASRRPGRTPAAPATATPSCSCRSSSTRSRATCAPRMIRANVGAPDQLQHEHAQQRPDVPGVPAGPGEPDPRGRAAGLPGPAARCRSRTSSRSTSATPCSSSPRTSPATSPVSSCGWTPVPT